MVALVYCIACQHGHHERCGIGTQAAPPGMLGGTRCRCKGECVERRKVAESVRDCPLCEGKGCGECGDTGRMVRTAIDMGDGVTFSVSGNAPLNAEAVAAVARAALAQMEGEAPDGE